MTGLGVTAWDAVIVGDGSGSTWNHAVGWAAVLHDRATAGRKLIVGAANCGTNQTAELMPYLQAMQWYRRTVGKPLSDDRARRRDVVRVHVVTDAQTVALAGARRQSRDAAADLWAAFDLACRPNYAVTWHWLARSRLDLNRLTDYLSRTGRQTLEEVAAEAARRLSLLGGFDLAAYNPTTELPAARPGEE